MSVELATDVSWCVACWQQQPQSRHVVWNVAYDGGAKMNENGYPTSTVDDLVLCEHCVKAATELLHIVPQVMADREREVEALKGDVAHWRDYARRLEDTIPRRPGRPARVAA